MVYKGPHVIILFKIIRFYLKKTSETNTTQGKNRDYSTDALGSLVIKLWHWKINENDSKVASKSYCCLADTKTFLGSHLSKNYGNGNTADN